MTLTNANGTIKNFESVEKFVRDGRSEVFKNWHEFTDITMDEFIDGLKWLSKEPFIEIHGKKLRTRAIGCDKNGVLHKLKIVYTNDGHNNYAYEDKRYGSGFLWTGEPYLHVFSQL